MYIILGKARGCWCDQAITMRNRPYPHDNPWPVQTIICVLGTPGKGRTRVEYCARRSLFDTERYGIAGRKGIGQRLIQGSVEPRVALALCSTRIGVETFRSHCHTAPEIA